MADVFIEEVVVKRQRTVNEILYFTANILMVVFAFMALMLISPLLRNFSIQALLFVLAFLCIAIFLYFNKDQLRAEYEYTLTNTDLDFALVLNNKKRKTLGTIRINNVSAFGPVNSNNFSKIINMPELKQRKWFLNREANLYYFFYQKDGKKNLIVFEPSELLVNKIKINLPHGIYQE